MKILGKQALLRIAALAAAGMSLSGCVYDVGLGYASDGYYDDYGCDPYGGYDSYYDCDNRSGFYNIGFGGGWYDNYWYPGYGYNLFDNYGRRYAMRDNHRRYWGEQRHRWYREHRGRDRDRGDHGNYQGRGRGYSDQATPDAIGWPERNGGRMRDGEGERRGRGDGQGRRHRNDQWRGGAGDGANAIPVPNPEVVQGRGRGQGRGDGYGRRGDGDNGRRRGDGQGRPNWRGNNGGDNDGANAVPVPQAERPAMERGGRGGGNGRGGGEGRGYRQPPPQSPPSSDQSDAPAYRPAPEPRAESPRHEAPRQRVSEGGVEQPD